MTREARLVRGAGVAASVVLMLLAGCGRPPGGGVAPDPEPTDRTSPGAPSSGGPSTPGAASAEPTDAEDASFSFDDIASYAGDAEIEITGTVARTISTGMKGAESTGSQMVVVSVLVRNVSTQDLDATTVLVTAASGPDDIEAPLIGDPSGGLANAFLGVITPGAEDTADYGFAIPFTALNRVRVTVDLGDGLHEPVSFTGAVQREQ
ncbi:MAG TPA: hypothetical protein VIT65_11335 [Microlunatus sp.]